MSETMTDMSEMNKRVSRIEGAQQYLPLLLKRFEGIEDRLEADLNDLCKENSEGIKKLQSDNRNLIIALILTGLGVAASISFT